MMQTEEIKIGGYERVVYAHDPESGLKSIISIHNTNLGPACGGIRLLNYGSRDEALQDVLRLSKGMSYKSALAGIQFGGGKSVILCDPAKKTKEIMIAFGRFVDSFGGKYISAKDMNIEAQDLLAIKSVTKHVLGIDGVPGSSGDPSPVTALGVMKALEATAEELFHRRSLKGLHVAIQGIGHVGYRLAELLREAGAKLTVSDVNARTLEKARVELNAEIVDNDEIFGIECDIFSPCARGAILNSKTIPGLKCKAVVGAANNQLAIPTDGETLHKRGILYAPDYAVNAGGIINVFGEHEGYQLQRALQRTENIFTTMKEIYRRARTTQTPPFVVADKLAEERMGI